MKDGGNSVAAAAVVGPQHSPPLSLLQQAYIELPLLSDSPPADHMSTIKNSRGFRFSHAVIINLLTSLVQYLPVSSFVIYHVVLTLKLSLHSLSHYTPSSLSLLTS